MVEKPTLMQLRRGHNYYTGTMITSEQLANAAEVLLADEFRLELGSPVSEEVARRVMRAFSRLTGQSYSPTDICMTAIPISGVSRQGRRTPEPSDNQ